MKTSEEMEAELNTANAKIASQESRIADLEKGRDAQQPNIDSLSSRLATLETSHASMTATQNTLGANVADHELMLARSQVDGNFIQKWMTTVLHKYYHNEMPQLSPDAPIGDAVIVKSDNDIRGMGAQAYRTISGPVGAVENIR